MKTTGHWDFVETENILFKYLILKSFFTCFGRDLKSLNFEISREYNPSIMIRALAVTFWNYKPWLGSGSYKGPVTLRTYPKIKGSSPHRLIIFLIITFFLKFTTILSRTIIFNYDSGFLGTSESSDHVKNK